LDGKLLLKSLADKAKDVIFLCLLLLTEQQWKNSPPACRRVHPGPQVSRLPAGFHVFFSSVSTTSERYLRFYLISTVNFYYVINKLIILISGPH
jgi:hypothetical protein